MATSLDTLEKVVHIDHLHQKRFCAATRLRKSVQYIPSYSARYANFCRVVPKVHEWALSTHEIFARCRDIIATVDAHVLLFRFGEPVQMWEVCDFATKLVAIATSLEMSEKRSRSNICTQSAFIQWKIAKISPVDPKIIVIQAIIKKRKKLMQA